MNEYLVKYKASQLAPHSVKAETPTEAAQKSVATKTVDGALIQVWTPFSWKNMDEPVYFVVTNDKVKKTKKPAEPVY